LFSMAAICYNVCLLVGWDLMALFICMLVINCDECLIVFIVLQNLVESILVTNVLQIRLENADSRPLGRFDPLNVNVSNG